MKESVLATAIYTDFAILTGNMKYLSRAKDLIEVEMALDSSPSNMLKVLSIVRKFSKQNQSKLC